MEFYGYDPRGGTGYLLHVLYKGFFYLSLSDYGTLLYLLAS